MRRPGAKDGAPAPKSAMALVAESPGGYRLSGWPRRPKGAASKGVQIVANAGPRGADRNAGHADGADAGAALRQGAQARSATLIEDYVELIADLLAAPRRGPRDRDRQASRRHPSDRAEEHRAAQARGAGDVPALSRHFPDRRRHRAGRKSSRASPFDGRTAAGRRRAAGGGRSGRGGHGAPRVGSDAEGFREISGGEQVERPPL